MLWKDEGNAQILSANTLESVEKCGRYKRMNTKNWSIFVRLAALESYITASA